MWVDQLALQNPGPRAASATRLGETSSSSSTSFLWGADHSNASATATLTASSSSLPGLSSPNVLTTSSSTSHYDDGGPHHSSLGTPSTVVSGGAAAAQHLGKNNHLPSSHQATSFLFGGDHDIHERVGSSFHDIGSASNPSASSSSSSSSAWNHIFNGSTRYSDTLSAMKHDAHHTTASSSPRGGGILLVAPNDHKSSTSFLHNGINQGSTTRPELSSGGSTFSITQENMLPNYNFDHISRQNPHGHLHLHDSSRGPMAAGGDGGASIIPSVVAHGGGASNLKTSFMLFSSGAAGNLISGAAQSGTLTTGTIDPFNLHDLFHVAKTGFLLFGGLCSKMFGMGLIGFLAFQSMTAPKSELPRSYISQYQQPMFYPYGSSGEEDDDEDFELDYLSPVKPQAGVGKKSPAPTAATKKQE
ncbi:unnamed protein product [Amoebophrya sp. A120]|nr:unnamed protein product [Amoebophrya sp. A120]|eukprot:GSA120T00003558001.1